MSILLFFLLVFGLPALSFAILSQDYSNAKWPSLPEIPKPREIKHNREQRRHLKRMKERKTAFEKSQSDYLKAIEEKSRHENLLSHNWTGVYRSVVPFDVTDSASAMTPIERKACKKYQDSVSLLDIPGYLRRTSSFASEEDLAVEALINESLRQTGKALVGNKSIAGKTARPFRVENDIMYIDEIS